MRVTVELVPRGGESQKRTLGVAEFANDWTGTDEVGNYRVSLFKWGTARRLWKEGFIQGFPRKRFGPWDLLFLGMLACLGEDRITRLGLARIKTDEMGGKPI